MMMIIMAKPKQKPTKLKLENKTNFAKTVLPSDIKSKKKKKKNEK